MIFFLSRFSSIFLMLYVLVQWVSIYSRVYIFIIACVCIRTSVCYTKNNLRFFSTSRTYLWFYLRNFLCGLVDMCVRVLFGIFTPASDIGSRNEPILARRCIEIWKMQTRSLYVEASSSPCIYTEMQNKYKKPKVIGHIHMDRRRNISLPGAWIISIIITSHKSAVYIYVYMYSFSIGTNDFHKDLLQMINRLPPFKRITLKLLKFLFFPVILMYLRVLHILNIW